MAFGDDLDMEQVNSMIGARDKVGLLYIYSKSCAACSVAKPLYDELKAASLPINFGTVCTDTMPDVWEAFSLTSIPSFLFVGGEQALGECRFPTSTALLKSMAEKAQAILTNDCAQ